MTKSNEHDPLLPRPMTMQELVIEKSHDAETTPGFGAPFSPDEADYIGAFEEDALTENDVLDSTEGADDDQS